MRKEKKLGIIGGVIVVTIIGILLSQFSSMDEQKPLQDSDLPNIGDIDGDGVPDEIDPYVATPRVWQTSGPFQIDREQYLLGELVLIRMNDLDPNEKGQIAFLRPSNGTHYTVYMTIPFDGSGKFTFNQYFKPSLSKSASTCSKNDLLGNWTVVFRGTEYENLKFEIIDKYIPGEEKNYEKPIC